MNTKLQLASSDHFDQLLPLVRAYHTFEEIELSDSERSTTVLNLLNNNAAGKIWLIFEDNKLAGYIVLCVGYSIEFNGFDAFVDEFYLSPEFRNKGIGKNTIKQIKIEVKKSRIKALHFEVAKANRTANQFYTQLDFVARDKFVLMSCKL